MRVSVSRGEPLGRELTGFVYFWRRNRGAGGGEIRAQSGKRHRGGGGERIYTRTKASRRNEPGVDFAAGFGESDQYLERAGRGDDRARNGHADQQESGKGASEVKRVTGTIPED